MKRSIHVTSIIIIEWKSYITHLSNGLEAMDGGGDKEV